MNFHVYVLIVRYEVILIVRLLEDILNTLMSIFLSLSSTIF